MDRKNFILKNSSILLKLPCKNGDTVSNRLAALLKKSDSNKINLYNTAIKEIAMNRTMNAAQKIFETNKIIESPDFLQAIYLELLEIMESRRFKNSNLIGKLLSTRKYYPFKQQAIDNGLTRFLSGETSKGNEATNTSYKSAVQKDVLFGDKDLSTALFHGLIGAISNEWASFFKNNQSVTSNAISNAFDVESENLTDDEYNDPDEDDISPYEKHNIYSVEWDDFIYDMNQEGIEATHNNRAVSPLKQRYKQFMDNLNALGKELPENEQKTLAIATSRSIARMVQYIDKASHITGNSKSDLRALVTIEKELENLIIFTLNKLKFKLEKDKSIRGNEDIQQTFQEVWNNIKKLIPYIYYATEVPNSHKLTWQSKNNKGYAPLHIRLRDDANNEKDMLLALEGNPAASPGAQARALSVLARIKSYVWYALSTKTKREAIVDIESFINETIHEYGHMEKHKPYAMKDLANVALTRETGSANIDPSWLKLGGHLSVAAYKYAQDHGIIPRITSFTSDDELLHDAEILYDNFLQYLPWHRDSEVGKYSTTSPRTELIATPELKKAYYIKNIIQELSNIRSGKYGNKQSILSTIPMSDRARPTDRKNKNINKENENEFGDNEFEDNDDTKLSMFQILRQKYVFG